MKKRVIFIVVTALLCCLLVACGSKTRLQAPQNIRQNGPFLIWDEVKNAEGYIVLADNEEYVTAEPSCNLSFLGGETVYVVKIKAVGDGENFADSDWSEFGFNEIFKYTLLADGSGYEGRFYKCGICTLMRELGLYDLTPAMCHLDYTMAEAGGAADFMREYTLASGGPYCDCGYKKKTQD